MSGTTLVCNRAHLCMVNIDMSRNAHNNKNGKNGKISPTTTWRPMQMRRQEGPLVKPANLANLAKIANWSKSPSTWRPMQMSRQEGPLVKPANLANFSNLAKMANWSKSPTTWRPMQMRGQEGPLVKPANLSNLAKMANWSNRRQLGGQCKWEDKRAPL